MAVKRKFGVQLRKAEHAGLLSISKFNALPMEERRYGAVDLHVTKEVAQTDRKNLVKKFSLHWVNRMTQQSTELELQADGNYVLRLRRMVPGKSSKISFSREYDSINEAASAFMINVDAKRVPKDKFNTAHKQCIFWMREVFGNIKILLTSAARGKMRYVNRDVYLGDPNKGAEQGRLLYLSPGGTYADVYIGDKLETIETKDIWYK